MLAGVRTCTHALPGPEKAQPASPVTEMPLMPPPGRCACFCSTRRSTLTWHDIQLVPSPAGPLLGSSQAQSQAIVPYQSSRHTWALGLPPSPPLVLAFCFRDPLPSTQWDFSCSRQTYLQLECGMFGMSVPQNMVRGLFSIAPCELAPTLPFKSPLQMVFSLKSISWVFQPGFPPSLCETVPVPTFQCQVLVWPAASTGSSSNVPEHLKRTHCTPQRSQQNRDLSHLSVLLTAPPPKALDASEKGKL